ncbi:MULTISPECIES: hypothetical protein [Cetobacterium]|jgi:hypothetical protein|uniref:Type II secretion system protein GspG C-terminal domain-containing protein n=1 Tax=Candidatus Cetobacterium colombiensis TaxID=3073100 RepID=A0ABU4WCE7_9FUSO|nr:hypothetical protein [Candidatus Cetobacterium colombiensis]MDX8336369.1 hypothetical protein [Candidatus Cetobacterium colombiensis]
MEKDGRITTLNWIIYMGATILFIYLAMRGIDDLTGTYKIDETIRSTKELRIALEKYYQLTGNYPNLTKPGVNMNLHLLDYIDSSGKEISFAEIYGRKTLAKTYGSNSIIASNEVYDIQDFEKGSKTGGWNYNYSQGTGEIHPNLPEDIYLEKVNWNRQ